MSISAKAVIIAGVIFKTCTPDEQKMLDEIIQKDDLILDYSPLYDAYRYGVVGICVKTADEHSPSAFDAEKLAEQCSKVLQKFNELTGMEGKIYLSTYAS